jgi:hypothetical protein
MRCVLAAPTNFQKSIQLYPMDSSAVNLSSLVYCSVANESLDAAEPAAQQRAA